MKLRSAALATAAISLVTAPVVAQATLDRSSAPIEGESLEGNGILIAILAAAAVIAGIIIIADDDDDEDEPVSP